MKTEIYERAEVAWWLLSFDRRASGSRPDSIEEPPCKRAWCTPNPLRSNIIPLVSSRLRWLSGKASALGPAGPKPDSTKKCPVYVGIVCIKPGVEGQMPSSWCGAKILGGGTSSGVVLVF
ncbi:hypothetical protein AVEN_218956-1 [Araneus ventricosus]|uniref:Uncharacterized protein n=1 Tax=Araneus ventricosus TaxID=182803 RepID=A0A4Y2CES4_ARAVE|nr:hypothetical protein AVEN_218956-1 [Araneus ventricosus]